MKNKDLNHITELRAFFDLDKEIEFINDMNRKGWKLVYIKLGAFYTFEKTEPDEYITMLYADKKENLSRVITFAAQCGYESIPHSADGFGDLIYFTGKKSEVSDEFANDTDTKINSLMIIHKKMLILNIVYHFFSVLLIGICLLYAEIFRGTPIYECVIAPIVFTVIYILLDIRMSVVTHKVNSKIKRLITDKQIYE